MIPILIRILKTIHAVYLLALFVSSCRFIFNISSGKMSFFDEASFCLISCICSSKKKKMHTQIHHSCLALHSFIQYKYISTTAMLQIFHASLKLELGITHKSVINSLPLLTISLPVLNLVKAKHTQSANVNFLSILITRSLL